MRELYSGMILVLTTVILISTGCGKLFKNLKPEQEGSDENSTLERNNFDEEEMGSIKPTSTGRSRAGVTMIPETPSISSSTNSMMQPEKKRIYKNGMRATKDDFIDQSQEEGSLWASTGQTNYYFTKNKIRIAGELISVTIENDLFLDIGSEIKRMLSPREKARELVLLRDQRSAKDHLLSSAASPEKTPSLPDTGAPPVLTPPGSAPTPPRTVEKGIVEKTGKVAMTQVNFSEVDIYPSISLKVGDVMMGEILERFSNGNYKIKTTKRIAYKQGPPRTISVVGIVRPADINDDTGAINSGKIYEYRVEVAH